MKVFSCKKFEVHVEKVKLPNGKERELQYVKHRGSSVVIPILDGKLILIKQYRPVIGKWIYEFPAGTIEENEDPLTTAKRELIEEIGYEAKEIVHLFDFYPSPGITNELMHMYLAKGLTYVGSHPEEYEVIEPFPVTLEEALSMLTRRDIEDAKTVIGVLYLDKNRHLIQ